MLGKFYLRSTAVDKVYLNSLFISISDTGGPDKSCERPEKPTGTLISVPPPLKSNPPPRRESKHRRTKGPKTTATSTTLIRGSILAIGTRNKTIMDYGIVMKAIQLARDTMERLREHVLVTV